MISLRMHPPQTEPRGVDQSPRLKLTDPTTSSFGTTICYFRSLFIKVRWQGVKQVRVGYQGRVDHATQDKRDGLVGQREMR